MRDMKKRYASIILLVIFLLPLLSPLFDWSPIPSVEAASVMTGTVYYPYGFAQQRASFFDGTYWWLFLYNGNGYWYSYATNPLVWENPWTQLSTDGFYSRGGLDVAYDPDNDRVMVSYGFYSTNYRWIAHNGTIDGNSISWTRTQLDSYASYYHGLGGDYIPASGKFVYLTHRYDVSNPYVVYHNWTYPSGWSSDIQLDLPESINSNIGGTSVVGGGDIWMNFVMNGGAQLRYSVYDNTLGSVEVNAKGGQASFSALPQGSVVHLVYLNSTDDIVYRRYDGSWGDRETVYMGTSDHNASFPVIAYDETGDTIYVVWGDATDDCIYVKTRDSSGASGNWDASPSLVIDASDEGLTYSAKFGTGGLSIPEYMNNTQLPLFYVTGSGAPYSYRVIDIPQQLNSPPSRGYYTVSFFEGDELYSDGEIGARFWFTATDPDGYADINEMEFALQIGETWCNFSYDSSDPIGEGYWTKTTEQPYIEMFDDGWSGYETDFTMFAWIRVTPDCPIQYNLDVYQRVTDASAATSDWGIIVGNQLNIVEAPEDDPGGPGPGPGPPPTDEEEPPIFIEPTQPVNDTDGDGLLDDVDPDIDGDGVPNERDNDMDGDGTPNSQDPDLDGDGVPNANDWGPYDPADRRMGAEEYGIQIGRSVYPIEDVWIRKNGSNIIILLLILAFLMWTQREEEDKPLRTNKKKKARGESLLESLTP